MFRKALKVLKTSIRHHKHVVAFAMGVSVSIIALPVLLSPEVESFTENTSAERGASSVLVLQKSQPVRLRIPKIRIDTTFEAPLGVTARGASQVPKGYAEVGWYQYSPTPGELGPSVILGHIDSYIGPAVFYSLGRLQEKDEIFVERMDGTTAVFAVTMSERTAQNKFPTERVYGDIDHAGLRLITCSGAYNHSSLRYTHNLIVYAELVRVEE